MRTLLLAVVTVTVAATQPALAAQIPITDRYGSEAACALYKAKGADALYAADIGDNDILIDRYGLLAREASCVPDKQAGPAVLLLCEGPGESPAEGEDQRSRVLISVWEDAKAGTLQYTDEMGTMVLFRCP